ncbi:retrovirus-related Pol polyprotein from transposon 412 [Trichonephila clavipes]|nr:retrovirus-related Pol polyprotein from transposon 412 [Trichonephila clavipes]
MQVRNANHQLLQSRFIDIHRFVLARDPNTLEESISAALIDEQNVKLNQIANDERSGFLPSQTETSVISALTNKIQEINLRVERLQEASSVMVRKKGGDLFRRRETVFKCFYCGFQGHRHAECRKKRMDERRANYQPPRLTPRANFLFSVTQALILPTGDMSISKNRLFAIITQPPGIRAFARSTVELSAAATEHHRISLQHDYPIKCPIYKIPFSLRNEFRRQIADLEKAGIISKSNSQYNTLVLFVKQRENWRLVLDFRKLNEITLTQDFVISTLDDILHEISGSNYFSALDMKSAFNQIPLHFADRHKTAFSTPDGFVVTPEGILIDKDKSVLINPPPGQNGFFRPTREASKMDCTDFSAFKRYIKNFAKRALPLTNLLRKDTPFEWTSETQEAFDDTKNAILNPPVLALPDPDAELQIPTDTSSRGIEAVLEQKYPNSEVKPLYFFQ